MKSSLLLAAVGLTLSLSSASVLAQMDDTPKAQKQTTSAVDPAAAEFITSFRTAIASIHDISCKVTQSMSSDKATTSQSGEFLAVIDHPKDGQGTLKQFVITGKGEDFDAVWSFDGEKACKLDRKATSFQSMKTPDGKAYPVQQVSMVVPTWVYGDVLNNKDAKVSAAKFLPDEEMDGVNCRVIKYSVEQVIPDDQVERSDDEKGKSNEPLRMVLEQVRHVGMPDLIPRKIESHVSYTGPWKERPAGRTFTGVYSNVRVNANPTYDAFVLSPPGGYKTIEAYEPDLGIPSDKPPRLRFAKGDQAPDFSLQTPDGTKVTLASLKGRIVLLDFWATWCGPCKMAMPGVQSLHEKYKGKPVAIFGVDTFEPGKGDKAAEYMHSKKYTYGLLVEGDALAKEFGIGSIPTFVLIGPDGKVIYTGVGFHKDHEKGLAELIDKALPGT
jgi:thiol-disulfide isomerase/thioredoxin